MGGEHRANDGIREEVLQFRAGNGRISSAAKRVGHGAFARCRSGQRMGSSSADVMLVFGNVGELRKVPEGGVVLYAWSMRGGVKCPLELGPWGFISLAVKTNRG